MLNILASGASAFRRTVLRLRSWPLHRRLLLETPAVVIVIVLVIGLIVGHVTVPGSGGTRYSNANRSIGNNAIRLAHYTFHLPPDFHATTASTSVCNAWLIFGERIKYSSGSVPQLGILTGTGPYSTARIASAAGTDGGCVEIGVTRPFTPNALTANPNLGFEVSTSSVRRVVVAGHLGWLTTAPTSHGPPMPQLAVELPQSTGQMRDLGLGASGLSANELLTIVSRALS